MVDISQTITSMQWYLFPFILEIFYCEKHVIPKKHVIYKTIQ